MSLERVAQLRHGPGLDLADALTGEVEVLAHLFEGAGLAPVEAEAQLQDLALALVERAEQPRRSPRAAAPWPRPRRATRPSGPRRRRRARRRRPRGAARDSERGSAAKRSASVTLSSGISTSADSSASVAGRPSFSSRRARAFCRRASVSPACTGQADGAAGVGDAAGDRLADPPRGVGRELEALAPVELLDGVHQAEVALLDEVEQRQARRLVLLGDRHDQAQVRLHERALGVLAVAERPAQLALAWPA